MPVTYRLQHDAVPPGVALRLDPEQERVAAHAGGPLLVLAGPGTGKTATVVETVARRVLSGADPASLLVLTFSRRAAVELRERLALRLGGATVAPAAWTFHSFCLSLLTEQRVASGDSMPRLLSGPEQDVVVRELLRGDADDGRWWPQPLGAVLGTRGLADEVRALVARAQLVGLDPAAFARVAAGRADWLAVADFYERYLAVLDAQGLLDYAELVARAAAVAARPEVTSELRCRIGAVWVDEYQDTDTVQEGLLRSLAGDGRDLTVVGDPDQAIYGFRGADVRGILRFPDRFRTGAGDPAPVVALQTCRRSGRVLVGAGRAIADHLPAVLSIPAAPGAPRSNHRRLQTVPDARAGTVAVHTYTSATAEAEAIADMLRRAHLDDGTAWARMAVLVRSGVRSIPLLRRVLGSAGVPVEVAADELPLADDPAVSALLVALQSAADPLSLDVERARVLLCSPLVGADATDVRRLGRALRHEARRADTTALPPPSDQLLLRCLTHPELLLPLSARDAAPARRLLDLLGAAELSLRHEGGSAGALWAMWSRSGWRLRLTELAGGPGRDARAADRDLDAVTALFDAVGRAEQQRPGIGVRGVLETLRAQQIPAAAQDERAVSHPGVRLLTAHRSKGLEWDIVVVAGVQEGSWPDLRSRGSLLQPDALGPAGAEPPPTTRDLLNDERRLFYVACTRARQRLVVTAVGSSADDGERPSRFLRLLSADPELGASGRPPQPPRPRTLAGLVAALRHEMVDPAASPASKAAAAARIARLAAAVDGSGRPLAAAAHPDRWWGLRQRTDGPAADPKRPLPLSASTLTGLADCPLRWYLGHEVHAQGGATVALGFGRVIHALADVVARGGLAPDEAVLAAALDRVWPALGYDTPYFAEHERTQAQAALGRLARQLTATRGRTLVGTEAVFDDTIELASGPVRLWGRVDRVEVTAGGAVVVVDLKTGRSKPSVAELEDHLQLALYQYVVDAGALEGLPQAARSAGAELWHLRQGGHLPAVQAQPPTVDHGALLARLDDARLQVVDERFPATPGKVCNTCVFVTSCPAQDGGRAVVA